MAADTNTAPIELTLVNQDCRTFLAKVPSDSVDLVLTDPPYDISRETGFKNVKNGVERFAVTMDFGAWDKGNVDVVAGALSDCYRVLRAGGTAIVFYDLWKLTVLADLMKAAGFTQLRFIEWVKTNPVPINSKRNYLTNAREMALVGVKKSKPTFFSEYDKGIYEYPICHDKGRFHPTQKPLALIEALINKHSKPGDVTLDCFSGSFTTAVAAARTGRNFLGCELDKTYYAKGVARVQAEASRSIRIRKALANV